VQAIQLILSVAFFVVGVRTQNVHRNLPSLGQGETVAQPALRMPPNRSSARAVCERVVGSFDQLHRNLTLAAGDLQHVLQVIELSYPGFGARSLAGGRIGRPVDASPFQQLSREEFAFPGSASPRRIKVMSLIRS